MRRLVRLVVVVALVGCGRTPAPPLSPSPVDSPEAPVLTVGAPTLVAPVGAQRLRTMRPTFRVANAEISTTGPVAPAITYEFEVTRGGAVVERAVVTQRATETRWRLPRDLDRDRAYRWRVRAIAGDLDGPWAPSTTFRTAAMLQCPSHLQCGGTPDGFAVVQQVATRSREWAACRQGDGVACFRFTNEAATALYAQDASWGILRKVHGEWQCTPTRCSTEAGGYGEDALMYALTNQVIDIIGGAGQPRAWLTWQVVPRRRTNTWALPIGVDER